MLLILLLKSTHLTIVLLPQTSLLIVLSLENHEGGLVRLAVCVRPYLKLFCLLAVRILCVGFGNSCSRNKDIRMDCALVRDEGWIDFVFVVRRETASIHVQRTSMCVRSPQL